MTTTRDSLDSDRKVPELPDQDAFDAAMERCYHNQTTMADVVTIWEYWQKRWSGNKKAVAP